MTNNAHELLVTMHQLTRFADLLEALRLSAEQKKDYGEFAHLSPGYLHKIRELSAEIKEYVREHPEEVESEKSAVLV